MEDNELEPAAYVLTTENGTSWAQTVPGDPHPYEANNIQSEVACFAGRDIIQLIDNLLSEMDEERFDSPKGAESVLLQLKSEIQSLEVERSDD